MPLADPRLQDPEVRRRVITSRGLSADEWDISPSDGTFFRKAQVSAPETTSTVGALVGNAAYSAPEAVAGLAGGRALGALVPMAMRALGAAPHPIAKLAGFVGGALAGPTLTAPLTAPIKEAIAPGSSEYIARTQTEHPIAAELGQAASSLVGLRPSTAAPIAAARGVRSLIAGVPLSRLSAAQTAGITDVGVASALGAGIPIAQDVAAGEPINPLRALAGAVGNVAMSEPHILGRRLFGLSGIPSVDTGNVVPRPEEASQLLSPSSAETPATAPVQEELNLKNKKAKKLLAPKPPPTEEGGLPPAYREFMRGWADQKNVEMTFKKEVEDEYGIPVAGKLLPSANRLGRAVAEISSRAGVDTPPHELLHNMLIDMSRGTAAEQRLVQRMLKAHGGLEDTPLTQQPDIEEALVQRAGTDFVYRMFEGEEKGKSALLEDLLSTIRTKFGQGQPEDYTRIAGNILRREGSAAERLQLEAVPRGGEAERERLDRKAEMPGDEVKFESGNYAKGPVQTVEGWEVYNPKSDKFTTYPTQGEAQRAYDAYAKSGLYSEMRTSETVAAPGMAEELNELSGAAQQGLGEPSPRYSRFGLQQKPNLPSRTHWNPLSSEVDKLRRAGPAQASLADAFDRLFANWRNMQGRYSPATAALVNIPEAARQRVYETLIDERRQQQNLSARLTTPQEQAAYRQIRDTLKQMAIDQQAARQPVNRRQRGIDRWYMPMTIDTGVRRILAEGQNTPEFNRLRNDFVQYQIANGATADDAAARFNSLLGSFHTTPEGNKFSFKGVREAEGFGLPDSWIERDPVKAMQRYTRSFTRDRAFWDTIESDPRFMRMLGSNTFASGNPISPQTKAALPNLAKDPQVNRILSNYIGADESFQEPLIASAGRAVNAAILGGPITKFTDIATVPFKALAYTANVGDVLRGIKAFVTDFRSILERTYRTGLNRPGASIVARDILGIGEQSANALNRFAEFWTKWTGSEALEKGSRVLSQSIGEFIGQAQRKLARAGAGNARKFLEKLGSDWDTISDEELGTRVAQLMQGRYDITNLPEWIRSSPLAPFVTMMRWSTEQANNFSKFVIEPARRGDYKPLAMTLVGGIGGGLVIEEMREQISGKEGYTPNLKELEEGAGKPGFVDAITYKMMSAAQVTGTLGIFSEIMKQLYEAATGRMPQGFRYPVLGVFGDILQRFTAAAKGITDGEDWTAITSQLVADVTSRHVQAARIIKNQLGRTGIAGEEDYKQAEQRRDRAVFERMEGVPQPASVTTPPSYSRLTEKKQLDRASVGEAAQAVPALVKRAVQQAQGDPEILRSQLRRLRTIGGLDSMPSPETVPGRFMAYYDWVRRTQGEDVAKVLLSEFLRKQAEGSVKRALIPSL